VKQNAVSRTTYNYANIVHVSNLQRIRIFISLPALLCLRRLCTAEAVMFSLYPDVLMSSANMATSAGRMNPLHTCRKDIIWTCGL